MILSLSDHIFQEHFLFACLWMHVLTMEASFWRETNTLEPDMLAVCFLVLQASPPCSSVSSPTWNSMALVL